VAVVDAILMDFEMPVMKGPEATQLLRNMGVVIPIIGVTGNVLEEDKRYFKQHGANDVLCKPTTLEQLQACFEDVM
jgi:CheY-like chemotaxis protein